MKKIILLLILLLTALVMAQSYSRWNYKDSKPNDATADAKLIADFQAAMDNHATGDLRIHKSYRYPTATDSSFELPDMSAKIVRLFDPTPAPDGATELAREDTVIVLSKHSPLVKTVVVGGDGILPAKQTIPAVSLQTLLAARKEAKLLRKAVNDSIRVNPVSGNTKAKRAKVWKSIKAKKKAEKSKGKASANKAKTN